MTFHWDSYSAAVDAGWAKAGITCVSSVSYNKYYRNGNEITQKAAYDFLRNNFPKIREANVLLEKR